MDIVGIIAEGKIREAMEKGEFGNLSGRGKPLNLDDLTHIPEELRAGYIILKNAGVLPEEIELKKEIVSLQKLIDCCHEDKEKNTLKRKLTLKVLRFEMLMENKKTNSTLSYYKSKIHRKLGGY